MKVTKQTQKRRRLVAETEELTCRIAREKRGNKCEICGKTGNTQCHHFIPKSRCLRLRFDPENIIVLCFSCHHRFHYTGDPRIPEAIIEKRGRGWWEYLAEKSKEQNRSFYSLAWIKGEQEKLKEYLNEVS